MKVRWTRDGVRLRITPTELGALLAGEPVREALRLPGGGWTATVRPGAAETGLTLTGSGDLYLALSVADLARLSDPEAEGVYFDAAASGGSDDRSPLRYFIEKDFPCAHPRAAEALEPPTETFAPPPGFEERKAV